jgi:hypothetical protein
MPRLEQAGKYPNDRLLKETRRKKPSESGSEDSVKVQHEEQDWRVTSAGNALVVVGWKDWDLTRELEPHRNPISNQLRFIFIVLRLPPLLSHQRQVNMNCSKCHQVATPFRNSRQVHGSWGNPAPRASWLVNLHSISSAPFVSNAPHWVKIPDLRGTFSVTLPLRSQKSRRVLV